MKFVVDKNIPLVEKAFQQFGNVTLVGTPAFSAETIHDADVLIVRSETKVEQSLLDGARVKFIGTATIGTDHIDLEYLKTRGIAYANAPGCNSDSVKEYIAAALLHLAWKNGFSLKGKSIGIIGVGNVGSKVAKIASALGMNVLVNDPPLAKANGGTGYVSLDEVLSADIVTLHVPLTKSGPDATHHLFNDDRFQRMKPGAIFINTSRGAVVETAALKRAIIGKQLGATVIDVWENEPRINSELATLSTISTPHIAGYSIEGKLNAVRMIREAITSHFHLAAPAEQLNGLGKPAVTDIVVGSDQLPQEEILQWIVQQSYDIMFDDGQIRRMLSLPADDRPALFMRLRSGYRIRREFSNITVHLPALYESLKTTVIALGFNCIVS